MLWVLVWRRSACRRALGWTPTGRQQPQLMTPGYRCSCVVGLPAQRAHPRHHPLPAPLQRLRRQLAWRSSLSRRSLLDWSTSGRLDPDLDLLRPTALMERFERELVEAGGNSELACHACCACQLATSRVVAAGGSKPWQLPAYQSPRAAPSSVSHRNRQKAKVHCHFHESG